MRRNRRALRRADRSSITWACTIKEMDATRDMETPVMAPINFTQKSHFSRQKLSLMKANPKTLEFEALN